MTTGAAKFEIGGPEALEFATVYRDEVDFVWRTLRSLGVPEAQVADATQEVFLVVHRRLAEFEGQSTVRGWLFGIARHVASNQRRSIRRKAETECVEDELRDPGRGPHDIVAQAEAARLVARILADLDDDKRCVFVAIELEQMSAPEVAVALGLSVNTVYSRLRAARQWFERRVAALPRSEER